jgi:NAD(P)-dependent dehydrogenase (short-subunit alcohol dehydrogenase family)
VLVHAAGIYLRDALDVATLEDFDRQWRVNTRLPYELTQAVLPDLIPGGSVIFVTSKAGHVGMYDRAAYGASKAATEAMMRSLAVELAPRGVRVNSVVPGFIASPMNEKLREDEALMGYLEALVPAGRLGSPDDVAAAATWLASDEAAYVYGHSLCVDGGYPAVPSASSWFAR